MPRKIVLEHDVEASGKRIKLIGVTHGAAGVPLGLRKAHAIKQRVKENPEAVLYSEKVSTAFLPKKLLIQGQPLESEEERKATQKRVDYLIGPYKKVKRELQISGIINFTRDAIGIPEKPFSETDKSKVRRKQRASFQKSKTLLNWAHNATADAFMNYVIIYRSAKFAEKLANSKHGEIIAVMGAGHVPLVKKFLENETLRRRYLQQAERKIHAKAG